MEAAENAFAAAALAESGESAARKPPILQCFIIESLGQDVTQLTATQKIRPIATREGFMLAL